MAARLAMDSDGFSSVMPIGVVSRTSTANLLRPGYGWCII